MAKTKDLCVKFFLNVACQKLLKSANVSQNYFKKIIVASFYGPRYIEGNSVFQ